MDNVQDHKLKVDGLNVYYWTAGNPNNQPLVFLHGHPMPNIPASTFNFSNVLFELSKFFYVVAPEHVATMRSDPPKRKFDIRDRALHIDKFLRSIQIDNFVLMGQSFGGGVALVYSSIFPRKVRKLILVDSLSNHLSGPIFAVNKFRYLMYKLLQKIGKTPHSFYFVSKKVLDKRMAERYIASLQPELRRIKVNYKKINSPTLLVWGNRDMVLTPIWGAYEMEKMIPNSKLIIVKGGHTILYEKPRYVVGEIIKNLS